MLPSSFLRLVLPALLGILQLAQADQTLSTTGFSSCDSSSDVTVQKLDITYSNDAKTVTFDVAGTSTKSQKVMVLLNVTAYGINVYSDSFNPCDESTYIAEMCPIPEGSFSATGTEEIPPSYATLIPSIAFQIPDIDATATMELKSLDTGEDVACIQSNVGNGKTVAVPAVSYVAAGIAGAALIMSGLSAMGSGSGGSGTPSPGFVEVLQWFQGIAMNGMMSVNYPGVYREFTQNFAFSTGLISWKAMQQSIDSFRASTGGNLTTDSVEYLDNSTLVWSGTQTSTKARRTVALLAAALRERDDITFSQNSTTASNSTDETSVENVVSGITGYVEALAVPEANTFLTVLLIGLLVVAVIAVGILLLKVILEVWSLWGSLSKSLNSFRKRYWGIMGRTILQLILAVYGIWVLYCIFQFTHGDSWAAQLLAAVTLAVFTSLLAWYAFRIWRKARTFTATHGDASPLYFEKETWIKYGLFYDCYQKRYWWIFIPSIIYMFAKGCILAAGEGSGMVQTIGQLVVEGLMLALLLWNRPFERRSGNVINLFIQIVRVLSVICILVFVEELGISQTTQTITGVVLVAVQSLLTVVLAILICFNALLGCCKENPHRRRRKEAEKLRQMQGLTPAPDAHSSLLQDPLPKTSGDALRRASEHKPLMDVRHHSVASSLSSTPYAVRDVASPDTERSFRSSASPVPQRRPVLPSYMSYESYHAGY